MGVCLCMCGCTYKRTLLDELLVSIIYWYL